MSHTFPTARAASAPHPGVAEIAAAIVALRPLWRLAGYALLTALLAVAHVGIRLRTDRLERELGTIEAQAGIAEAWQEALDLDLETRRSTARLEEAGAALGMVPATRRVRVHLEEVQ